jgi:hypothetical protein
MQALYTLLLILDCMVMYLYYYYFIYSEIYFILFI